MKSACTFVDFTPKINALQGQRGNSVPLVGHCILHTPTEWLQGFKSDQPFLEPGCSQAWGWHNLHRAHPPTTCQHGSMLEFPASPHDYRQSIQPFLWEASKGWKFFFLESCTGLPLANTPEVVYDMVYDLTCFKAYLHCLLRGHTGFLPSLLHWQTIQRSWKISVEEFPALKLPV
jgi:hypothetical protein